MQSQKAADMTVEELKTLINRLVNQRVSCIDHLMQSSSAH